MKHQENMYILIAGANMYILIALLMNIYPAEGSIEWCRQEDHPPYNLTAGVHCDKLDMLVSFPTEYKAMEKKICSILFDGYSQMVKFKHINGFLYGGRGPSNVAYSMQKWAIINLQPADNLWLEFGVAGGFSVNMSAVLRRKVSSKPIYGFDWFRGLPETWDTGRSADEKAYAASGTFTQNGIPPSVLPNVKLINGLFNETLADFLRSMAPQKVSFVNMDMDLYNGAYYVLKTLIPYLSKGAVIHFHEFYRINELTMQHKKLCIGDSELEALYQVLSEEYSENSGKSRLRLQLLPFVTPSYRASAVLVVL